MPGIIIMAAIVLMSFAVIIVTIIVDDEEQSEKERITKMTKDETQKTICSYKNALHKIMTSDEIDNLIKTTKGGERRWLKKYKKEYLEYKDNQKDLPVWVTLPVIRSISLMQDVIVFMFVEDDQ